VGCVFWSFCDWWCWFCWLSSSGSADEYGYFVRVVGNLSGGSVEDVQLWLGNPCFEFVRGDLKDLVVAGETVKALRWFFLTIYGNPVDFPPLRSMVLFC